MSQIQSLYSALSLDDCVGISCGLWTTPIGYGVRDFSNKLHVAEIRPRIAGWKETIDAARKGKIRTDA
jgi:hypothetical protein